MVIFLECPDCKEDWTDCWCFGSPCNENCPEDCTADHKGEE